MVSMKPPKGHQEAKLGSLDPSVLGDLLAFREFMNARDKAMRDLVGIHLHRNRVRDEIIRTSIIEFASGRLRPISFYQRECELLASPTATRAEVAHLCHLNLLIMTPDPSDKRAALVVPTQRLVDWHSEQVPIFTAEVRRLFNHRAK